MEELVSFGNDSGSIILCEYNELLKEIYHTGEPQLLKNVKDHMKHSVDDNQLLTDDQAVILQAELKSLKILLEKNQILKHVGREVDQRLINTDSAINELENVIKRKEKVNETMEQVLAQSMKLYQGREKILSTMEKKSNELWEKLQKLEIQQKQLCDQLVQKFNTNYNYEYPLNILKQAICKSFQNNFKFELKSFSYSTVYFQMSIKINDNEFSKPFFHFFLKNKEIDKQSDIESDKQSDKKGDKNKNSNENYFIKHIFYESGSQSSLHALDIDKINSIPFLLPFLIQKLDYFVS